MAIESSIETIITQVSPDATFRLASKFRANLQSFEVNTDSLPLIILDNELPKNNYIAHNGSINKGIRVLIYVLNLDSPDNSDNQTNVIQQAMELIADKIALRIFRLDNVMPNMQQKYKVTPIFHFYNTDMSGVALEINVIENNIVTC